MMLNFEQSLMILQVAHVPEDVGSAGALRAIAHHLSANDIMVVNLICACILAGDYYLQIFI